MDQDTGEASSYPIGNPETIPANLTNEERTILVKLVEDFYRDMLEVFQL